MSSQTVTRIRVSMAFALAATALAQQNTSSLVKDPGPRSGSPGAGAALPGLTPDQLAFFTDGQSRFQEVDGVATNGLGPRFNSNSCSSCHSQPAVGGSSPQINPQMAFANSHNRLPSFIRSDGPVREARFIQNPDGTPDGGVHGLFVIAGLADASASCIVTQEDFSNASNISLRIPTPAFGLGLVEAIPDAILIQNLAANSSPKSQLGITGKLNRNGNDGSVTRFGWKAQNKSLLIFSGEAYVEMGITNSVFPNERDDTANCSPAASPQDIFKLGLVGTAEFDDVTAFATFMRFLAPPIPAPAPTTTVANSVARGTSLFTNIGCAYCHTTTLQTGQSSFGPALSNQTIHPYSDFALHGMGPGLADQIAQGAAAGDEFRTAPLWGLGQRLYFLHDGRTSDLLTAITAHSSQGGPPNQNNTRFPASEATGVIRNFNALNESDKQALLNFLRSL